jgi:hypothetical protein
MGLSNYAHIDRRGLLALGRPVVDKKMPVHDWLWDNYGNDEHLFKSDTNPRSKQGSGVFKDYIAVVEQRQAFFTRFSN